MRTRAAWALLLTAGLAACDSSTVPEFLDFSGDWTFGVAFGIPDENRTPPTLCSVTGIAVSVDQNGPAFTGATAGGTEQCARGSETWPSDEIGDLTISAGVAGPAGSDAEDAIVFTLSGEGVSLTFVGGRSTELPEVDFIGVVTGTVTLDPFQIGETEVTGTWTAVR